LGNSGFEFNFCCVFHLFRIKLMKNTFKMSLVRMSAVSALALSVAFLGGCSDDDNGSSGSNLTTGTVKGTVVDANNNSQIANATVTVDGDDVKPTNGAFSYDYQFSDSTKGNESAPVNFVVTAAGYLNKTRSVSVEENFTKDVTIKLVSTDDTKVPANVGVATGETATSNGMADTVITASTTSKQYTNSAGEVSNSPVAKVSVPASTPLKTASGDNATGKVTLNVVSYAPDSTETENILPDAVKISADIVPYGIVEVEMVDENGNQITDFGGNNIDITLQIKEGTTNKDTGVAIQVDDAIPVFSKKSGAAKWESEGNALVSEGAVGDGMFDATFSINHLTTFAGMATQTATAGDDLATGTGTVTQTGTTTTPNQNPTGGSGTGG
jgi:hypothetical protein